MQCKECGELKTRVERPREPGQRAVWIDSRGRRWNGYQCPDCKSRPAYEPVQLTSRLCRSCKTALPPSRYFNCETCLELPSDSPELALPDVGGFGRIA